MDGIPFYAWIGGAILVLIILALLIRKVAEPNEALIITGIKAKPVPGVDESQSYKIVTGAATYVLPGFQTVRKLKLNLNQTDLTVTCTTSQGIAVSLQGSVIFKIGDTYPEIANAARRFLGQQDQMVSQVHSILEGHLREIAGGMTMEQLIGERETLRAKVREASGIEMAQLGLKIDSLQILKIDDPSGYIKNLAAPHEAAVASTARIAKANSDQTAAKAEAEASVRTAEAQKEAATKRAIFDAEVQRAQATTAQAGPLAEATARQQVVQQETAIAKLEALRERERLSATQVAQAEADADTLRLKAQGDKDAAIAKAQADAEGKKLAAAAEAEAIKVTADAEAEATRLKGQADADAIKAKADAVAANLQALLAQTMAEQFPEIVAAAAAPLGNIKQMTVLDGASGVTGTVGEVIAQVGAMVPTVLGMFGKDANVTASDASTQPTSAELVSTAEGRVQQN